MQACPGQMEGSTIYHWNGFNYRKDKSTVTTINYRCIDKKCPGRARHGRQTPNDIQTSNVHIHAPNDQKWRTSELRTHLHNRATSELQLSINQIFQEECKKFPAEAVLLSPPKERRRMHRARRTTFPKIPNSYDELSDLLLKDETLRKTYGIIDDGIFFLKKVVDKKGKMSLVFSSQEQIECLKVAEKLKVDGTFRVLSRKPKGSQLFTVHACHGNNLPSCVLMEAKTTASYQVVLAFIKDELAPDLNPLEVVVDFEKGLRLAIRQVFKTAKITGCYFHFTQAVQKQWSRHGLLKIRKALKTEARDLKNGLLALPFGRVEDIRPLFDAMADNASVALRLKVKSFLEYFRRTWLSTNSQYFNPEDFSVYGLTDRTNNDVESYHSRLLEVHPNIWVLLEVLKSKHIEAGQNYQRHKGCIEITARTPKKILVNEERLANARGMLEAGEIDPMAFILFCRTSVRDTLAIVRKGRRLKRLLRAQYHNLDYSEVPTSSDSESSISMDSDYDYEYEPTPYRLDLAIAEDAEAEEEWTEVLRRDQSAVIPM